MYFSNFESNQFWKEDGKIALAKVLCPKLLWLVCIILADKCKLLETKYKFDGFCQICLAYY